MAKAPKDELPEKEVARRRDKGLFNLLKTPPKPHAEIVGKGEGKGKPKGKKKTPDK